MPDRLIALRHDEIFQIFTDEDQQLLETLCTHMGRDANNHDNFHDVIMDAVRNRIQDHVEGRMPRPDGDYRYSLHFLEPDAQQLSDFAREMRVTPMAFVQSAVATYHKMLLAVRADQQIEVVTPPQEEKREPFEMVWP